MSNNPKRLTLLPVVTSLAPTDIIPVVASGVTSVISRTNLVTGLAVDSAVVHNTGNETIAGIKTFSSAPVVPSGAFPESAVANLVSDLAAKAADSAVVHNTGAETVAGVKTFSSAPVVPSNSFPESAINGLTTDLAARVQLGGDLGNTTASPQVTSTHLSTALPIAQGGTGQGTANAALNALLPSQTGNAGKILSTDGSNPSWVSAAGTGDMLKATYDPANIAQQVLGLTAAQSPANKTFDSTSPTAYNPPGMVVPYAGFTAPAGWLLAYGQAVSRATYATLFSIIVPSLGSATVTIASPGVWTLNGHGLQNGDAIYLTTTGALPTGLSANTIYYVVSKTTNTFQLSAGRGGSAINTSGSQSGTHTPFYCPYGLGDGSTTFTLPDMRSRVAAGFDGMGGTLANIFSNQTTNTPFGNQGVYGGEPTHTQTLSELVNHKHAVNKASAAGGDGSGLAWSSTSATNNTADTGAGGGNPMNVTQPTVIMNYIIKT